MREPCFLIVISRALFLLVELEQQIRLRVVEVHSERVKVHLHKMNVNLWSGLSMFLPCSLPELAVLSEAA